MELDLPTGTDSGGGDHLAKFLSTLTELVDLLGKTGPGGASGGASPTGGAADSTGGKNLIKATQKLFTDLANAFKPLKTVLSKFGTITPAAAKAEPAPAPAPAPIALEAPAAPEAQADEAKPKRKGRKKKGAADAEQGPEETPLAALTIQDASIGIDYASVKMPAAPAPKAKAAPEPEPKEQGPTIVRIMDVDAKLAKITLPTASFRIASALLQGKFLMPPEAERPAPEAKPEPEPKAEPKPDEAPAPKAEKPAAQKTPKAEPKPDEAPAPKAEKPAAQKTPKAPKPEKTAPKTVAAESKAELFTAINVFKRYISGQKQFSFGDAFKSILQSFKPVKAEGEKAEGEKATDAQEENAASKEASQNLQSALINIANGVVNVTTAGEKKEGEEEDTPEKKKEQKRQEPERNKKAESETTEPSTDAGQKLGKASEAPAAEGASAEGGAAAAEGADAEAATGAAAAEGGAAAGGAAAAEATVAATVATGGLALLALAAAAAAAAVAAAGALVVSGVMAPFKVIGEVAITVGKTLVGAMTDPIATFAKLSAVMIGFVSVVNPAAVDHFNRAIKDTTAVVGKSMIGALNIFTTVQREFADVLSPIMRKLTSTIDSVAASMGGMFFGMIRLGGVAVTVLLPVFKAIGSAFSMFFGIISALSEALAVIIGGFSGMFDGLDGAVQSMATAIVDIVKVIARATVQMVALIAKIFGATGFLNGMKNVAKNKGASERDNTTGLANPTGAHFESAEGFGKSIAQASFTATSAGAAPKKTDDFLADIAKDMETISTMDLKQLIIDALVAAAKITIKEGAKGAGTVAFEGTGLGVAYRTGNAIQKLLFG